MVIDINTLDILKTPSQNITVIHILHCIGEMALAPLVESHLLLYEKWWKERESLSFYCPDWPL
jgi:hypothetical protein